MIDAVTGFVAELRSAGLPVSLTESVDAVAGLRHLDLADRPAVRAALAATLVKRQEHRPAFDALFDLWFPPVGRPGGGGAPGVGAWADLDALGDDALVALVAEVLTADDPAPLAALAAQAVARFSGMAAGRHLGSAWHVHRAWRALDVDGALARLVGAASLTEGDADPLAGRLAAGERRARADRLRVEVEAEVTRRLVAERGAIAVGRAGRRPLPEDVDFMHASREELAALRRSLQPLARRLGVRLARRRRHRRRGALDFRATARHSLSYGGVPAEPRFRHRRPVKPELVVVADVSGSVAAFARFTLQLVYALSAQFTRVRSFVFVDGVDEVTSLLAGADDLDEAVRRVNAEADVVWAEGHSDYGQALAAFAGRWGGELTPRTTVVVLGDARSNYHDPAPAAVAEIARRSRHLWWLNPEPRSYWDTGDSVMAAYAPSCDGVFECRNLRQLQHFVEQLA
ncbi:MAG: VWA domain-containing protein [Acidimicrobiales bacterium]